MNVNDCMREIRKATDAIDTLDRYLSGEMGAIAEQHITPIKEILYKYIDLIGNKTVEWLKDWFNRRGLEWKFNGGLFLLLFSLFFFT